jgi:hypothetical protein
MSNYQTQKELEQLFQLFRKLVTVGSNLESIATRLHIDFEHVDYPTTNFIDAYASIDENNKVWL